MKIVKLTAENVKRLKAVEIRPDGTVQVITGRNAQGKTSVLDAIWLALGGGAASRETARPIRDGEDEASVILDLGDLIVTRTWVGDKTTLSVTSADGAKYSSPQGILDALVGRLSFDPLAFTRLSARDQVSALLDLVELPFDPDELERRRLGVFDRRTELGRDLKRLEGHLASLPKPPDDTPDFVVDVVDLVKQVEASEAHLARINAAVAAVGRADLRVSELQEQLDEAVRAAVLANAEADAVTAEPRPTDPAMLREQIASAESVNGNVRARATRATVSDDIAETRREYDAYTAGIEALDAEKAAGLAAASFPIDGLGFDDDGVTYNGVPFSQASAAEQIRVSLAMAMALNPKLRVIRILDGSLLDAENLKLIADAAAEQDFQIWIEKVADGSNIGVTIEDGEVAA